VRCRLAHNHDTARRRGLTSEERSTFLALLRSGKSVEEAAEDAGVAALRLVQTARRDGELRAALDGMPVEVQVAAQRAEFLAALVRCGGNQYWAEAQAGLRHGTVNRWRQNDQEFDRVVVAVLDWLNAMGVRHQRKPVPKKMTDEARALLRRRWNEDVPVEAIASELGVSERTVTVWRKRLSLPTRQPVRDSE
jgi:hypothetical protein